MISNNTMIKDANSLYNEIIQRNPNFKNINFVFNMNQHIKNYYKENIKSLGESSLIIKVKESKKKIKSNPNDFNNYIELISIMIKINEIIFRYKPREIQIIAVLFFLFKDKNSGLIEEILTGEGKTIIISFLAVIKALQGKKIDILTSSLVLAERDAKEMKEFYNFFGLSVDFCKKDCQETFRNTYIEERKEKHECFSCYKADIVYGDPLSFEGDILRTNFMGLVGRGNKRSFDCIIIDEIDNICIDNIKNITELLDNFHGYKFLEYIYLFIYEELIKIDSQILEQAGFSDIKHDLFVLSNKKKIVDDLIKKAEAEFFDLNLLSQRKKIFLPEHLANFIKFRIKKWCESAFDARYIYKENREYIIAMDEQFGFNTIKPVDFSNTGVIQENSVWTGLHQFLQIKEGLRLTEENLNSCYMSNFTFFKKYISAEENNIYGLTGTLGSPKTQEALKILYQLNLLFIPTFKKSKLIIDNNPIVVKDVTQYEQILMQAIKNIAFTQGRAVLVIFKYIENVNSMYNLLLQNGISPYYIIKYSRNDINNESNFLKNEIKPHTIILSTNLSGRGTDIKISPELEQKNGLHVILTFLPFSERIERQAFGRAGRKGERGSGQLIIYSQDSIEEMIKKRKIDEENEFNYLIKVYKRKIDLFEELFDQFTHFLNKMRKKNIDEAMLLDIKERWGIFLVENDLAKIEKEYKDESSLIINEQLFYETRIKFENFMNDLKYKVKNNYEFLNPLLLCKTFDKKKCDEAIIKSPFLTLGAYSFRTLVRIDKKKPGYINDGLLDFRILQRNCNILIGHFSTYKDIMGRIAIKENSDLYIQNEQKIRFMYELVGIINKNINILNFVHQNRQRNHLEIFRTIITLKQINKYRNYNDDILDYFKDYGMCLYEFSCQEIKRRPDDDDNCNIF